MFSTDSYKATANLDFFLLFFFAFLILNKNKILK